MRPNTPEGIRAEAEELARDDIRRHREFNHALNVFSTDGARNDWQRGFDNAGPRSYEGPRDFDTIYQRGRAVARLLAEESVANIDPMAGEICDLCGTGLESGQIGLCDDCQEENS